MKVEIDADELCELRTSSKALAEYNRTLLGQLAEAHAKNVDYHVKCDWKELSKERDFWRDAAISYENLIIDSVRLLDDGPMLSFKAEELGYEVPE